MKRRNSVDVACAECGATIRAGQGVKLSMISMAGSSIPMGLMWLEQYYIYRI